MKARGSQSGHPSGALCACGCGLETRRYGTRVCRYVGGHFKRRSAGHIEEDRGYETPCWIWLGGRQEQGYGRMSVDLRNVAAHRAYYEAVHGPIPEGLQLDHLCRVPSCVNPAHLEPVTPAENVRRGRRTILRTSDVVVIKAMIGAALAGNGGRAPAGLYDDIASTYGVAKGTIRAIRKGELWRDV